MKSSTTFSYKSAESNIPATEMILIGVDNDDTVTDQDVLTEIQTKSKYTQRKLVQLYESQPGEWIAYFKI